MSNTQQHLSRVKTRDYIISIIITASGLLVSWWIYDKLYAIYGAKPIVPDLFVDLFRLFIGITLLVVCIYIIAYSNAKQHNIH